MRTVTEGPFDREVSHSWVETADFLRDLADEGEDVTSLTLESTEWELPFSFREPVEVEVELEPGPDRELEIEFEFEFDEREDQTEFSVR